MKLKQKQEGNYAKICTKMDVCSRAVEVGMCAAYIYVLWCVPIFYRLKKDYIGL